MTENAYIVERLALPPREQELNDLAELLLDAVDSGAAISFLPPLTVDEAREWWRSTTRDAAARALFIVARDQDGLIVGTVQLQPAWAPNQPHRGDVGKLIVHRRSRGSGLGAQLMNALESAAREAAFTLLTLDTKRGDHAQQLYRRLGWTEVGVVPRYALNSDGTWHDTVIFYKELN